MMTSSRKKKWEEGVEGWEAGMYRSLDPKLVNDRNNGIVVS
jgi:hypothetical protein